VEFTAYVLDRETGELVWSSASNAGGDDGVFFFGAGRVHTSSELSCRMVGGVVDRLVGAREPLRRGEDGVQDAAKLAFSRAAGAIPVPVRPRKPPRTQDSRPPPLGTSRESAPASPTADPEEIR
jgi:hypothetical protein